MDAKRFGLECNNKWKTSKAHILYDPEESSNPQHPGRALLPELSVSIPSTAQAVANYCFPVNVTLRLPNHTEQQIEDLLADSTRFSVAMMKSITMTVNGQKSSQIINLARASRQQVERELVSSPTERIVRGGFQAGTNEGEASWKVGDLIETRTVTTNGVRTVTSTVPTLTLYAGCQSASQVTQTLPNGSVTVSPVYVTVTPSAASGDGKSSKNGAVIGGAVGGAVALCVLLGAIWILWRRNRKMKQQLEEAEEEEKRNTAIDVGTLLPSPYTEYPRNQSATPTFGNSPSIPGVYPNGRSSAYDGDLSYSQLTQEELALTDGAAPAAMSGIGTTQYTPTHSRPGSIITQDVGRPHSSAGGVSRQVHSPDFSRPESSSPGSGDGRTTPSLIYSATEYSQPAMSSAASAKAREAFQNRRSALHAQNQGDERGQYVQDDDIIVPAGASRLRSADPPPSAWAGAPSGPPPAYTPDRSD
ncbi:hypothetical protein FRC17_006341 [Serendipita sp. 399]|nr:hypothetical protein FRC17_006341 [Serendipita sp. 399]